MKILVANWKQNMNLTQHEDWVKKFESYCGSFESNNLRVVLCPSHPYLSVVANSLSTYPWIFVGSQDISSEDNGAHTGEVGASQVGDFAKYCIVGHSERKESDEEVQKKLDLAYSEDLIPILCFVDLRRLNNLVLSETQETILLWEDPGNISQGGVFSPKPVEEILEGVKEIRNTLQPKHKLIYGGSVNRQNAQELCNIDELDGAIAGNASLDPEHFFDLVKVFSQSD